MRKFLVTLALILVPVLSWGVACPAGYTQTETIRIPAQSQMSASTLTFQFYFPGHATTASVANGGYVDNADTTGLGVVFCDSTGTNVLSYELVPNTYNATTGAGEWHVGVTLSKTAATVITLKIGKSGATDMSCGPSGTANCGTTLWANFKLVNHFGTSGSLSLTDSTTTNTETNHGTTAVAGKLSGGANAVAASSQYIDVGAANNLTTLTYGAWVNLTSFQSCQRVISNLQNPTFNGYEMYIGRGGGTCAVNGNVMCQIGSAGSVTGNGTTQPAVTTGTWNLIYCKTAPSSVAQPYVNGIGGTYTGTSGSVGASSANLNIGRFSGGASSYLDGSVDEVRVYNGSLSTDYMLTQYTSEGNPASFYSLAYRAPAHFYISSSGSDSNNGTSTGTPWQTISKVNSYAISPGFVPGDEISFNGGNSFTGPLQIPANSTGNSTGTVTIDSYGTGNATITSGSGVIDGITLTDVEFYTIKNLTITGAGWTGSGTGITVLNGGIGIDFISTRLSGGKLRNNKVQGVTVSGYWYGMSFDASSSNSNVGFQGITIYQNTASNNITKGILVTGANPFSTGPTGQITNVYIGYNYLKNIPGDPNSGTGGVHGSVITEADCINVKNTTGLIIERNFCGDVAGFGGAISGPPVSGSTAIGIASSRNYSIDHNEVARTACVLSADGSGIDIDYNTQNGEIAYNLTYNNVGPGIQAGSFGSTLTNGAIHHNISFNDVRGNSPTQSKQGSLRMWGNTNGIIYYNNTTYMNKSGSQGFPTAIDWDSGGGLLGNSGTVIANNVFKILGGSTFLYQWANWAGSDIQIYGNDYDGSGGGSAIASAAGAYWNGGTTATTLTDWQALGYEIYGSINQGSTGDSALLNPAGFSPASSGVGVPLEQVTNFNLGPTSVAIGLGLYPWAFNATQPPIDYHRNNFQTSNLIDSGASSYPQSASSGGSSSPGPIIAQ